MQNGSLIRSERQNGTRDSLDQVRELISGELITFNVRHKFLLAIDHRGMQ